LVDAVIWTEADMVKMVNFAFLRGGNLANSQHDTGDVWEQHMGIYIQRQDRATPTTSTPV
jgi:hypothetical protein